MHDGWEAGGWAQKLRELPKIADIFKAQVYTREFTYKGLRGLYQQEFGKLCASVLNFHRRDAWDHLAEYGGVSDTPEMKRCRVAWIEFTMFAKCLLLAEKRGIRSAGAGGLLGRKRDERDGLLGRGLVYGARLQTKILETGASGRNVAESQIRLGRIG